MSSNETTEAANVNAIFEGFFIQMVLPGQEKSARNVVTEKLGAGWAVNPVGDSGTEFEVVYDRNSDAEKVTLSAPEAWEASYQLRAQPGVVGAEPLFGVPLPERPPAASEAGFSFVDAPHLAGSNDPQWSLKKMRIMEAWALFGAGQEPGQGVIVGHPDTGYRKHPELSDRLLIEKSYDFVKDDNDAEDELEAGFLLFPGHGTGTSSVIVSPKDGQANYPGGGFVSGIAPGAKLIPYRVSRSVILLSPQNLSYAIERAADSGAHVISISMGTGFFNSRLRTAVLYAQRRGVIIQAAAGNYVGYVVWPAAYDEVIAVAASNADDGTWLYSSRGKQVDVTAPGESVWRAHVSGDADHTTFDVARGSGTSFAVASVAGVAALWLSYHGRDNLIARYGAEKIPFIFNDILRRSCEPGLEWDTDNYGPGIVKADKVLNAPLPDNVTALVPQSAFSLEQNVPLDSGGVSTFAHLFEQHLPANQQAAGFAVAQPSQLRSKLAALLQTPEAELDSRLREVGQELAFLFTINPKLYDLFAATLLSQQPESAALTVAADSASSAGVEAVRLKLLEKGTSDALKMKIS